MIVLHELNFHTMARICLAAIGFSEEPAMIPETTRKKMDHTGKSGLCDDHGPPILSRYLTQLS